MSRDVFTAEGVHIQARKERYVTRYDAHLGGRLDGKPYRYGSFRYFGDLVKFVMSHDVPASTKLKLQAFYEQYKARKR